LCVSYYGGDFCGWQAQPHLPVATVQKTLEQALSKVAATPVSTHCAGRTDTGVHGAAQIVHFDDPVGRSQKAWVMGCNRNLPSTVRVLWARSVSSDFHARFSASSRHYRYIISNSAIQSPHHCGLVSHCRRPLDALAMHDASQVLLGEHDFSAFRAAQCQAAHPVRQIFGVSVNRFGDFIVLDIEANAFLYHMVRNLVGSLQMVGSGQRSREWIEELLKGKDRTLGGDTASASGLYLQSITYPEQFGLPVNSASNSLLLGGS
jgi:tRNA pseudouridine38-40 synthase